MQAHNVNIQENTINLVDVAIVSLAESRLRQSALSGGFVLICMLAYTKIVDGLLLYSALKSLDVGGRKLKMYVKLCQSDVGGDKFRVANCNIIC
jgi:hypothetical protein